MKDFSAFMTLNPTTVSSDYSLPNDLRVNFRQVALVKPDLGLILKAKCSSLGFKAPSVLALRLKLIMELTRDQL